MRRTYLSEKYNRPGQYGIFYQNDVPVFLFKIDELFDGETIRYNFTLSHDHIFMLNSLDVFFPHPAFNMGMFIQFFPQLIADAFDPITLN